MIVAEYPIRKRRKGWFDGVWEQDFSGDIHMDTNRRHFSRVTFKAPARLTVVNAEGVGAEYAATVLDLSLKGVLLHLDAAPPLRIGTAGTLDIPLDVADTSGADENEFIRMEVAVVHIEPPQWGFACRDIDLDSATHLRRLVTLNLGDASLLERELPALLQGF